ncbi:MAG: hypothetical protein AAGA08_00050 [Pseudomonadota bacterium]
MTEVLRKLGVGVAYETGRRFVGPLIGLALAATGAQAGAWEEFERRCLMPMMDFSAPDLTGLIVTTRSNAKVDPDLEVTFGHYQEGDPRGLDGFIMLISQNPDRVDECFLVVRSGDVDQLGESARVSLIGSDFPYVRQADEDGLKIWYSDIWREPVLSVAFGDLSELGGYVFLARETDLDS